MAFLLDGAGGVDGARVACRFQMTTLAHARVPCTLVRRI